MTDEKGSEEKGSEEKGTKEQAKSYEELVKENAELKNENAERRVAAKEAIEKYDAIKAAQDAAAKEAAEKQGEFKTLYESASAENEGLKKEAESLQKTIDGYLEQEIEKVPEDKRDAIPDLPAKQKLEWLQKFGHTLLGAKVQPGPGVKQGGEEEKNSITRQAFDALSPAEKDKHLKAGGKIHD